MDTPVDPQRPRPDPGNAFDQTDTATGQDYSIDHERAEGRRSADPPFVPHEDGRDIPPDNGQRASVDPRTGEVHGSGAGAGGGNPGEDFDSSSASGAMYPVTGSEGADNTPGPRADAET